MSYEQIISSVSLRLGCFAAAVSMIATCNILKRRRQRLAATRQLQNQITSNSLHVVAGGLDSNRISLRKEEVLKCLMLRKSVANVDLCSLNIAECQQNEKSRKAFLRETTYPMNQNHDDTSLSAISTNKGQYANALECIDINIPTNPDSTNLGVPYLFEDEESTQKVSTDNKSNLKCLSTCTICLVMFDEEEVLAWSRNPACNHAFHQECIIPWLMNHDECPNCRSNYFNFANEIEKESKGAECSHLTLDYGATAADQ